MTNDRHKFESGRAVSTLAVAGLVMGAVVMGPALVQGTTRAVTLVAPQKRVALGAENPAGVSVEISPGERIPLGAKVTFRVEAREPGYLIVIEADASGKVTQRYPNVYSMALPAGASEKSNLVQPGRPTLIPNRFNPFAAFEYVAEPPAGAGLFLALLSPNPVHVVDLPDVPAGLKDPQQAAGFLIEAARRLRIADAKGLEEPRWSIVAQPYEIVAP